MQFLYLLVAGAIATTLPLYRRGAGSCILSVAFFIIFVGCMADLFLLLLARENQLAVYCEEIFLLYFLAHLFHCWYALCRESRKWELINAKAQECRKASSWASDQRSLIEVMEDIQETMRKKGHHVTENDARRALSMADHPLVKKEITG